MIRKLRRVLKSEDGSYVPGLIYGLIFVLLLVILVLLAGLLIKYGTVKSALKSSAAVCAKSNLNNQYGVMIEGGTCKDGTDYDSYKDAFFKAMDTNLSANSEKSGNGETYSVYNSNGELAFTVSGADINVAETDKKMPDGVQKRLVYTATATLEIPVNAFGFVTSLNIPIKETASYQLTA